MSAAGDGSASAAPSFPLKTCRSPAWGSRFSGKIDNAIRAAEAYVEKHCDVCPSKLVLIYS
ncbi:hypothetical protein CCR94_08760 [Rhodoblastus sphagnicola]|uniref:Uncharacterized protein n=1 Tax=Rhodoblastus sphagnicola TaxID=333368 RepID=A0A2S6N9W7_9HYPH|nr:hypothetical protein CCR94_08760 [Rhodoblastus sphagnicola]